jgi:hypothetical protein
MSVKLLAIQRKLQIVLKLLIENKAVVSCIYAKAAQSCLTIHYVTRIKRHWSNRLWDRSAPIPAIYSQANNPGDHWMTDTNLLIYKPKNKSSAGNASNTEMYSIPCDSDQVCSQCGHNHSHMLIGGRAILDMISFLDRDITEKI